MCKLCHGTSFPEFSTSTFPWHSPLPFGILLLNMSCLHHIQRKRWNMFDKYRKAQYLRFDHGMEQHRI